MGGSEGRWRQRRTRGRSSRRPVHASDRGAVEHVEAVAAVNIAQGTWRSEGELLGAKVEDLDVREAEELGHHCVLSVARPVVAAALASKATAGENPQGQAGREVGPARDQLSGRQMRRVHVRSVRAARTRNKTPDSFSERAATHVDVGRVSAGHRGLELAPRRCRWFRRCCRRRARVSELDADRAVGRERGL